MSLSNAELALQVSNLINYWASFNQEYASWLGGTAAGGPNSDGVYELTDWNGVVTAVKSPARLQADVDGLVNSAAASAAAAALSETNAASSAASSATSSANSDTARAASVVARDEAVAAQLAAENAETTAIAQAGVATTAATNASASATTAAASETAAVDAQTAAEAAQVLAEGFASSASASNTAAALSATNAATSESNAATSATNSASSATDSANSGTLSDAARAAAVVAQTAAELAQTDAESAETTAIAQASAASTSATNASASETNAAASEAAALAAQTAAEAAQAGAEAALSQLADGIYFAGVHDASTGAPTTPTGTTHPYYKISVAGTINTVSYSVGDSILWDGAGWFKIDNTDPTVPVTSVVGQTGAVTIGQIISALVGQTVLVANLTTTSKLQTSSLYDGGGTRRAARMNDAAWLRLDPDRAFTTGIYCNTGTLRTDGEFQVGSGGTHFVAGSTRIRYKGGGVGYHADGALDRMAVTFGTAVKAVGDAGQNGDIHFTYA